MKKGLVVAVWLAVLVGLCATVAMASGTSSVTPDEALKMLFEGNNNFVYGNLKHLEEHSQPAVREELSKGQHPYAVVVTCSDSRLSPEILFDKGLGEVFVIRVAGNVVAPHELGSIEYAVEHLSSPLVMVLGHEKCGAVTATVDAVTTGAHVEGNIGSLVDSIEPAVEKTIAANPYATRDELIEPSIDQNVKEVAKRILKKSDIVHELVESGKVKVVGAKYDLDEGKVSLIDVESH